MIKAIAIDDEAPALKIIDNFCRKIPTIRLEQAFNKPGEALQYLRLSPADLLFLDINMPSLTGLELYKSIGSNTMVIFTTAHSEYAVEGFNLNAVDYLLKPFTFDRFQQAVNKALDIFDHRQHKAISPEFLLIRADYSLIKVRTADILYIEAADDYLKIHLDGKTPLMARMTMKALIDLLPAGEFIRTHRSYIVPIRRIENVRNKTLSIAGRDIPIGVNYEKTFNELLRK